MDADSDALDARLIVDDSLVVTAELEGMRRLAQLPRPKIPIVHEDLAGASCHWNQDESGDHRDLVRLRPSSAASLIDTLRAVQASRLRRPGGHLEMRGTTSSFVDAAEMLRRLGGHENLDLPRNLMARRLDASADELSMPPHLTTMVAQDAESLRQLRSVVGQSFAGSTPEEAAEADLEGDFFHAPGVMTYLAISNDQSVISTASLLIVDGVANIWSVATLPSERGQGAATAIMIATCVEARRQGALAAVLRTTDDLSSAGGLYHRIGFRRGGSRADLGRRRR